MNKYAKPKIFIGSSKESIKVASAIQKNLSEAECTIWNQGFFSLNSNTLSQLVNAISKTHFAIFIFNPDDIAQIRKKQVRVTRDNVIFEFGLFIGGLGIERVFCITPQYSPKFQLPTDLLGLSVGKYDNKRDVKELQPATAPFCSDVQTAIDEIIKKNKTKEQRRKSRIKKKKNAAMPRFPKNALANDIFTPGEWENVFMLNDQIYPPECFEIKDGNTYFVNGAAKFEIKNIIIDSEKRVVCFDKIPLVEFDRGVLYNELKIVDGRTYRGFEDGTIPIIYRKKQRNSK